MKYFLSAAIIIVSVLAIQQANAFHAIPDNTPVNHNFAIDENDTVVFDISQSAIAGNKVSFPVYINTDDTINALDFSFMYDEMNFSLDTIINLTAYLQPVYNYNSGTLYFTSYSLQEIEHGVNLLSVELNMLGHYLCSDDLDSVLVYLNGDACSVKVVECVTDGVLEKDQIVFDVFPNPVSDILNISGVLDADIRLLDMKGAVVFSGINKGLNEGFRIDVSQLQKGMYVLSIREDKNISNQKIVIN